MSHDMPAHVACTDGHVDDHPRPCHMTCSPMSLARTAMSHDMPAHVACTDDHAGDRADPVAYVSRTWRVQRRPTGRSRLHDRVPVVRDLLGGPHAAAGVL